MPRRTGERAAEEARAWGCLHPEAQKLASCNGVQPLETAHCLGQARTGDIATTLGKVATASAGHCLGDLALSCEHFLSSTQILLHGVLLCRMASCLLCIMRIILYVLT